ncbi:MAG: ATP-binding cassette domain-containing protein, partial [Alphaproteobacteria bacterium]
EVFELFPRLAERKRQLAGSLSGGEQQMLTLARALVSNPKLMLLDEPSAGLAVGIVATLVETINRIRSAGISILLVEQNVEIARSVADRCVVFSVGELVWRGNVSDALKDGELQRAYFGAH